jgi:hypothetical protein
LALLAPLALMGLAGCVDGEGLEGPRGETSDTGGFTLRGTVLSEELFPVEGAVVSVGDVANATTGADGSFEVLGLEAGEYRVLAQAIGFISQARTVTIGDGAVAEVQFLLAIAPIQMPYRELLLFEGYEVCSLTLGVFVFAPPQIPCTEERTSQYVVQLNESWRYLVVEMDWETTDSMWLIMVPEENEGCNTGAPHWCWNQIGTAPIRIEGGPNDTAHARQYALDGESVLPEGSLGVEIDTTYGGRFRDEVNGTFGDQCNLVISTALGAVGQQWNPNLGCGLGYGYSTGVRFTYYVSIFHWEPPASPEAYTAIPDQ